MEQIVQIDKDTKKQIYSNKENIIIIDKRIDMLEREHALSQRELKDDIKKIQQATVYEIKEMLANEYRDNQKWKNGTLVTLLISIFLACLTTFINNIF